MNYTIKRKDGIGETRTVDAPGLHEACEALSEGWRHPLDIQQVVSAEPLAPETIPAPPPVLENSEFGGKLVTDETGKARVEAQHAALISGGVNVNASEQLYATGTRMADIGYRNQHARKAEHDAKEWLNVAARTLAKRVQEEKREDIEINAATLASGLQVNGKIAFDGLAIGEQAIRGLSSRLESPMLGYVLGLRDRIARNSAAFHQAKNSDATQAELDALDTAMHVDRRAIASVLAHECKRNPDVKLKLRTRRTVGDVFAVVSPSYVPADAPEVIERLIAGMPADAKGSFAYDPASTAWELRADVWTPTPVDEQCVGEAFNGYASFYSRDNGTSRFRGGGGVMLIRCLNASTYTAASNDVSRMHRGGVREDIELMIEGAVVAISTLCKAWGTNRSQVIDTPSGVSLNDAIPGFWRYMLADRKSELAGVLPGRTETHVKGLSEAFFDERRDKSALVRSDFAQGWTRYIQEQSAPVRREAETAIGDWLVRNRALGCDLRDRA